MLKVENLTKKYGKYKAADGVSFLCEAGNIGILLGPNGAGKSTVIKSVAGLLKYEGSIYINGIPAREIEAKRRFSYVPELPVMYDALTVREHLEFITKAYNLGDTEQKIAELFQKFELTDKQDKLGNELSKGMMQKVSICCALLTEPEVILLDEPMIGLDPMAIKELKTTILELRDKGTAVLISTHMLEMVKELWDVIFIMDKGHIIGEFSRKDAEDKDIEQLFFEITGREKQLEG